MAFALQYTGKDTWINRRNIILLSVVPALVIIMVLTNSTYGLIWSGAELNLNVDFPILNFTYGPGYWGNVIYAYILLLIGSVLFIRSLIHSPKLQRGQLWVLLLGTAAPWLANIATVFNPSPVETLDLTPFAFTITGLVLSWGLYGFRLFDIIPVARHVLIENMSDGVIVVDTLNRIVDVNPPTERILNRPASEILGKSAEEIFSNTPDLLERFLYVEELETELVVDSPEGHQTYNLRISPLYDRRGHLAGRLVIWRDITESMIIEKAARESEERYRNLVELSPEAIVVHSAGKLVYINEAGLKLIGASDLHEIVGKNIMDFMHPDYHEIAAERVRKGYEEGEAADLLEEKMIRIDGEVIDVEVAAEPVIYHGESAVQVVIRDITERKRAEAKLQRQLKELTVLHAVASAGAEATSVDDLIEQATKTVETALYPKNFGVLLLDEKENVLREHASYRRERDEEELMVVPLGDGVTGTVAETGEPRRIGEVSEVPKYRREYANIHSELCVPIKVGQLVIGVINAESLQKDAYTYEDERLLLTLAGQLATAIEKVRLFEEVQQLAITDSLTNISNRRHFFELAEKEFERAKRYKKEMAAIMIDLDNFKEINDSFGHAVGDHVLKIVAERFGLELREVDVLGRYGGEEFSIILPETDLNGAKQLGERICSQIADSTVETDNGHVSVTLSVGIASLDVNCISLEALINRADQALYTAKSSGRNSVVVWEK